MIVQISVDTDRIEKAHKACLGMAAANAKLKSGWSDLATEAHVEIEGIVGALTGFVAEIRRATQVAVKSQAARQEGVSNG